MHSQLDLSTRTPCFLVALLLQSSERLGHLVVELVKLAADVPLALSVGRLEFHLRQLVHDVGGCVSDLVSCQLHHTTKPTFAKVMSLVSTARWAWS